jgi:hypothetical protein
MLKGFKLFISNYEFLKQDKTTIKAKMTRESILEMGCWWSLQQYLKLQDKVTMSSLKVEKFVNEKEQHDEGT